MSNATDLIMAAAADRAHVDRFIEVHTWAPREHAEYLAQCDAVKGIPFCWACADWHYAGEQHSQA